MYVASIEIIQIKAVTVDPIFISFCDVERWSGNILLMKLISWFLEKCRSHSKQNQIYPQFVLLDILKRIHFRGDWSFFSCFGVILGQSFWTVKLVLMRLAQESNAELPRMETRLYSNRLRMDSWSMVNFIVTCHVLLRQYIGWPPLFSPSTNPLARPPHPSSTPSSCHPQMSDSALEKRDVKTPLLFECAWEVANKG